MPPTNGIWYECNYTNYQFVLTFPTKVPAFRFTFRRTILDYLFSKNNVHTHSTKALLGTDKTEIGIKSIRLSVLAWEPAWYGTKTPDYFVVVIVLIVLLWSVWNSTELEWIRLKFTLGGGTVPIVFCQCFLLTSFEYTKIWNLLI